ncbi:kinase-like protein [Lophiostoma macrostomum CBS 122681]|uniref:Kinase-like protein n=1 Tax=Lophiostoma macrostomum CBS 122681 TaxID=1314788 RepID=A0A6A6THN2_9PLEO|nr:kinase-like protein [Lophiostoma macrostomum CBS 122681]
MATINEPTLSRRSERKATFVGHLVTTTVEMIEVIWPLETDELLPQGDRILPLKTFVGEALRRSRTSYTTLQVALYYLLYAKEHVPDPESLLRSMDIDVFDGDSRIWASGRRIFFVCLILASKYMQDRNYSARAWSKISGLKVAEINRIELIFLNVTRWKLHVPIHVWERWQDLLASFSPTTKDSEVDETVFSSWKATVGLLTPGLDRPEIEYPPSSPAIAWIPLPRYEFQRELAKRTALFKVRPNVSASVQSETFDAITQFSGLTLLTTTTSTTYQTARSAHTETTIATYVTAPVVDEDETSPYHGGLDASAYLKEMSIRNLIPSPEVEVNWSGQGQHVEFPPEASLPLEHIKNLGSSASAMVDQVQCRRIMLARKTMRCPRRWTRTDAVNEVEHLNRLRHAHIVQLVGTYVQNRTFAVLMYPAADCDLRKFMEDTIDLRTSAAMDELGLASQEYQQRRQALASFFGCLISALAYIHSETTKHMDIKPANVLVTHHSRSGMPHDAFKVYLADFGLSRIFVSDDSQTEGPTARTARYCAPEVYLYESRGRAADIFSMGCVFAEILTVYFGGDPEDLRDCLREQGESDHYHSNIERLQLWVHDCAFSQSETALSDEVGKENGLIAHHVNRMIDARPERRPTAAFLRDYFRLTDGTSGLPLAFRSVGGRCCDAGPEQYVAAGQSSMKHS